MSTLAGVLALLAIAAAHEVAIGYNAKTTDIQEKTIQAKSDQKFYDQIEASLESIAKQLNQLYANKVTAMKKISRLEANLAYAAHADHVVQSRGDCKLSEQEPTSGYTYSCLCNGDRCEYGNYCFSDYIGDPPTCHPNPKKCYQITANICPNGLKNGREPGQNQVVVNAFFELVEAANGKDGCAEYGQKQERDGNGRNIGWSTNAFYASKKDFDKHNNGAWKKFAQVRNEHCEPVAQRAMMPKCQGLYSNNTANMPAECWNAGYMVACPQPASIYQEEWVWPKPINYNA